MPVTEPVLIMLLRNNHGVMVVLCTRGKLKAKDNFFFVKTGTTIFFLSLKHLVFLKKTFLKEFILKEFI